ncbi:hypothetical protein BOTBODRAFT_49732 [Botryobasidium botryosum FD-172 SS1]|uniref:Uncharacterized protein n=1 Tax=Botryobasidium botryosum (strain FD-172 SS1) TaxID=930990 RepID=A0A067LR84_BOTB1|nr:hypothetical protein BOTBODRAFT_49732 [Botryobasidium botryosum FD-172 SS1]
MTAMETIEYHIHRIGDAVNATLFPIISKHKEHARSINRRAPIPRDPSARYEMSTVVDNTRNRFELSVFLAKHIGDPAVSAFWEKLKDFLISETRGNVHRGEDTLYSNEGR